MTLEEQVAELKRQIAEAETKLQDAVAESEKQKGVALNAEAKFKEHANETGENRKLAVDAAKAMVQAKEAETAANEKLAVAQGELTALREKQGSQEQDGNNHGKGKTAQEIADSLTVDEQKILDEKWNLATEPERLVIKGSAEVYKSFLLRAKKEAHDAAAADLSSWRNKPAQDSGKTPVDGDVLDKLFKRKKDSAGFVPDGPGGTPRARRTLTQDEKRPDVSAAWGMS